MAESGGVKPYVRAGHLLSLEECKKVSRRRRRARPRRRTSRSPVCATCRAGARRSRSRATTPRSFCAASPATRSALPAERQPEHARQPGRGGGGQVWRRLGLHPWRRPVHRDRRQVSDRDDGGPRRAGRPRSRARRARGGGSLVAKAAAGRRPTRTSRPRRTGCPRRARRSTRSSRPH